MIDCLQINHLINIICSDNKILSLWKAGILHAFTTSFSFKYILPQTFYVHVNICLALITYLDVVKHRLSQYD